MRTSLTRLVAGTAIAATALLAVAGTASASTATPKKSTTLSIVTAKSKITVGQWDTVGGTLASGKTGVPGRTIILDKRNVTDKRWYAVEEKTTGKYGKVVFNVDPKVSTRYQLIFKGGPIYRASHSGVVLVVTVKPVVKVPTSLSIAATPGTTTQPDTTISGALSVTKTGTALAHQWVWLAWVGSKGVAHRERAFLTGKYGKVAFKVHPASTTTYELLYLGTHTLAPTHSATVTVAG
jgi:hypothetical protein